MCVGRLGLDQNIENFNPFFFVQANSFSTMLQVPQIDLGPAEIPTTRAVQAAFGIQAAAVPRGPIIGFNQKKIPTKIGSNWLCF